MITKEELLAAFEESTRTLELNNQIFGLALKGLESESTVKRLIQDRDNCKMLHKDLTCEHRIAVGTLNDTVDGLRRNRNFWKKKHDDLADELDDKIIALKDELKAKDASLAVASKMIDDAQAKHGALQAQLKNTIPLQFHNAWEDDLLLTIISLRDERDAFQRSVSEMHAENNCMRADLENMCKELSVLKIENKKWEEKLKDKDDDWRLSVSYYMNLAAAWEKQAKALKAKLKKFEDFFVGED